MVRRYITHEYVTYNISYEGDIVENDKYDSNRIAVSERYNNMCQFHTDIFRYLNNAIVNANGILYPMIVFSCGNNSQPTLGYPEPKHYDDYVMYQTALSKKVSGHIQLKFNYNQIMTLFAITH